MIVLLMVLRPLAMIILIYNIDEGRSLNNKDNCLETNISQTSKESQCLRLDFIFLGNLDGPMLEYHSGVWFAT